MRSGLARVEKNELTRRALLDAARHVFLERGFHGASLDAVADAAGLTKGAVYSRFDSKADLFLALLEERIAERLDQVAAVLGSGSFDDDYDAAERQYLGILRTQLEWTLLVIEFRVHAARHPDLNQRYAALHSRFQDALVDMMSGAIAVSGAVPARSAEEMVSAAMVLATGGALELAADPSFPVDGLESWTRAIQRGEA